MRTGFFALPKSLVIAFSFLPFATTTSDAQSMEEREFKNRMKNNFGQSMPEIVKQVTHSFLDIPYVAHTLEGNSEEQLVCKFDGLDCTTLVENVLALSLTYRAQGNFDRFKQELTHIRYRNGHIDGYASRLHYFTDWMYENAKRGVLKDISQELGGVPMTKTINFMTAHPNLYPSAKSEETWKQLRACEDSINARQYYYIPLADIKAIETKLNHGDIIGIASTINGLDCNHMGIVNKIGHQAYLLHASSVNKVVELSALPLHQYVAQNKRNGGIFVARPIDQE
jgi:hypothetical protein